MTKHTHEIRDPVHVFIRLDNDEREVVNSAPFQRLRYIHQLALSFLVYPGATHRRFEHSLGVMELADRVFSVITADDHRDNRVRDVFPDSNLLTEWRKTLRMAALCHDIGHLPFSHAAEKELLPQGTDHENLTLSLIHHPSMQGIWDKIEFTLKPSRIAKLAVGPKKLKNSQEYSFNNWEKILAEIIVGDSFGVDRMDYLLRDSLHAGVSYGKFDHYRLIDTLRILPETNESATEPALGIESGGRESAEALLLARYFMYSQVYFHPVRLAYNLHLQDFMKAWLGPGGLGKNLDEFLELSDNEVLAAICKASRDQSLPGHEAAYRIRNRAHFRVLYQRNPTDLKKNIDAVSQIYQAAVAKFGAEKVRRASKPGQDEGTVFPVRERDDRIVSSLAGSEVLSTLPVVAYDYVLIVPEIRKDAQKWLNDNREGILETKTEEGDEK